MDDEEANRTRPNIVITGTPGTGKTTTAQALVEASAAPLQHINVVELVKQKELHDGFDQEWQSYIVDEDKAGAILVSHDSFSDFSFR
jgi:adenylate kinase